MEDRYIVPMLARIASNASVMTPLPKLKPSMSDDDFESYREVREKEGFEATSTTVSLIDSFINGYGLPDGYHGTYIGEKGEKGEWGPLILHFPILLIMLILSIIISIIGIIYCCCRRRDRCSPYRDVFYTRRRKCVRCCLAIAALILVILILWLLIICIIGHKYVHKVHNEKEESRTSSNERTIKHVLETSFDDMVTYSHRSADDLIKNNFRRIHKEISPNLSTAIICKLKTDDAMKIVPHLRNQVDAVRADVIEWMDFMRLFQRNMTFRLVQSPEGEEIMKSVQFATFYYTFLYMDPLVSVETSIKDLKYVITKLKSNLQGVNEVPNNTEKNVMAVLDPVLRDARNSLHNKGKDFRTFSKTLQEGDASSPDDPTSRSKNGRIQEKKYMYIPTLPLFLPWLSYVLIVLICIFTLIGIICALRKRDLQRSKWFLRVVCMIFACFAYIFLSILWFAFYGSCLFINKGGSERAIVPNFCGPGLSLLEAIEKMGLIDTKNYTFSIDVPALAEQLDYRMPNMTDTTEPLTDIVKSGGDNGSFCSVVIKTLDLEYLERVYKELSTYVNGSMANRWGHRDLSICHLAWLKKTRIDPFEYSELRRKAFRTTEGCEKIERIFNSTTEKHVEKCLYVLNEVETFYIKDTRSLITKITEGLKELYKSNMDAYIDMMNQTLGIDVDVCRPTKKSTRMDLATYKTSYALALGAVWTAMVIILLLLVVLLLAACILARLYKDEYEDLTTVSSTVVASTSKKKSASRSIMLDETGSESDEFGYKCISTTEDIALGKKPKAKLTETDILQILSPRDSIASVREFKSCSWTEVKPTVKRRRSRTPPARSSQSKESKEKSHQSHHRREEICCEACNMDRNTREQQHKRSDKKKPTKRRSGGRSPASKNSTTAPTSSRERGSPSRLIRNDSKYDEMCRTLCEDIMANIMPLPLCDNIREDDIERALEANAKNEKKKSGGTQKNRSNASMELEQEQRQQQQQQQQVVEEHHEEQSSLNKFLSTVKSFCQLKSGTRPKK